MNFKIQAILILLLLCSCSSSEESKGQLDEALFIYYQSELDEETKIDSSLILVNKALQFDDENFKAHSHKQELQFRKRDLKGIIETTDKLIKLRPNYPDLLGQKAFLLELVGDSITSKKLYQKSLSLYEEYIEEDDSDFNLKISYLGMLQASGDTTSANYLFKEMKENAETDWQRFTLEGWRKVVISNETIAKYWNGEIEYEEVGNDSN